MALPLAAPLSIGAQFGGFDARLALTTSILSEETYCTFVKSSFLQGSGAITVNSPGIDLSSGSPPARTRVRTSP